MQRNTVVDREGQIHYNLSSTPTANHCEKTRFLLNQSFKLKDYCSLTNFLQQSSTPYSIAINDILTMNLRWAIESSDLYKKMKAQFVNFRNYLQFVNIPNSMDAYQTPNVWAATQINNGMLLLSNSAVGIGSMHYLHYYRVTKVTDHQSLESSHESRCIFLK